MFLDFIRHIVKGEIDDVSRRLETHPATDEGGQGKQVRQAATSEWIRVLLDAGSA